MQSSPAIAVRALIMLACLVVIPAVAMSGASWPGVLQKFRNIPWPAILTPASASPQAACDKAPLFAPPPPVAEHTDLAVDQPDSPDRLLPLPPVASARPNSGVEPKTTPPAPAGFRDAQERLRQLGATYYLLESWGSQEQLYRFYCRVAVDENADYTRYFEAIHADPFQAMRQVLQQVEAWNTGHENGA